MLNSIAYSQDTRTKIVKVSALKSMGKELEKCNLLQKAFDIKNANFDSLTMINIGLFSDMKRLQEERKKLDIKLSEAKEELLKATKQKKTNWIVPGLSGGIAGIIIGGLLLSN